MNLSTPLTMDTLSASTVFKNGNISGGSLAKSGSGTVVLTGTSTYTGATSVNAGQLYVNGALSNSSTVSVANGAILGGIGAVGPTTVQAGGILQGGYSGPGTLTLSRLTFSGAAAVNVAPSTSLEALNVTGSNLLTANGATGSVAINIGTTSLAAGTYPLIGYSGAIQSTGSSAFAIGIKPTDSNFYTLKYTGSAIDLLVALNAPYWSGSNGTAWDTSTYNWGIGSGNGTPSTYSDGLQVVFDDTASGGTVAINGADVLPASVTFNNSSLAYTLQGTNAIAGSTGLTKNGTALVTIANTNSFTGAVTLNGGTVAVGSVAVGGVNSPLGAGTSIVFGGGALEYTGVDAAPATDRAITLNLAGGTVRIDNAGTMLTLSGSIGGAGGLAQTGPGGLTLGNAANSFAGGVTVNSGTLAVGAVANSGVNSPLGAGPSLTLSNGAVFDYTGVDAAPTTNRTLSLATTGSQTVQVVNAGTTLTLAGAITGNGGLAKTGNGGLVLSASNNYAGGTTISGGTLQVNADSGLGAAGTGINLANGAVLAYPGNSNMLRPIALGAGGGTITNAVANSSDLWLTGPISGGSLTAVSGAHNIILLPSSGTNSMASLTVAGSGITYIYNQNSIGTANISVNNAAIIDVYGGSLAPSNTMSFASGSAVNCRLGTLALNTANVALPSSGTLNCNIVDTSATGTVAVNGDYPVLTGGMSFNVGYGVLRLNGALNDGGSGSLTKTAGGTLVLAGTSNLAGPTTVGGGAIQLANNNALPNSAVSVGTNNGLSFALGTTAPTIGALAGNGNIALTDGTNPVLLTAGGNNSTTVYSGVLSNSGGLTKTGSGMLTLSSGNTYTGATTVSGGTLNVSGSIYTANSTQTINVAGGATLQVSHAGNNPLGWGSGQTWNVAGAVNLTAGEVQILPGTLNLNGGTLASTQTNATYGSYVVYSYNQLITAGGSGNCISSQDFGINGGYTLTLSTPLATDMLTASTVFKNGNIAGGALATSGAGTVVMTGTSTYTGATTVTSGTLQLGTGQSGQDGVLTGTSGIANNGSLVYNLYGNQTAGYSISGFGDLTKTGPGVLTLNGTNNSYGGTTAVNAGKLYVNGPLASSSVSVAGGATFGGQGTVSGPVTVADGGAIEAGYLGSGTLGLSGLTFNGSGGMIFGNLAGYTSTPAIGVSGFNALSTSGAIALSIGSIPAAGVYQLVGYSGTIQGSGSAVFQLPAALPGRAFASILDTGSQIELNVTGFDYLKWTGSNSTAWDTATQNWVLNSTGSGTTYLDNPGDTVVFDDSAGTNTVVDISTAVVHPNTVTFNNNAASYVLQGSLGIAGNASLTKNGTGSLTIANSNAYIGGTMLNAGLLVVNNSNALGNGPLTITGGSIDTTAFGGITLAGNAQNWNGSFTVLNTQNLNMGTGAIALNTSATVTVSAGTLTVGGAVNNNANPLTIAGAGNSVFSGAISGLGSLTINGPGTTTLTAINPYSGGTTVNGGTLYVGTGPNNGTGILQGDLVINSGATVNNAGANWNFGWVNGTCVSSIEINGGTMNVPAGNLGMSPASITLTGGVIAGSSVLPWYHGITSNPTLYTNASSTTSVISEGIYLRLGSNSNVLTFDVASGSAAGGIDLLVSGNITTGNTADQFGGIVKSGAGLMVLTGTGTIPTSGSNYTGNLTISGGTLAAAAEASGANSVLGNISNSRSITVDSGAVLEFLAPNATATAFNSTSVPTLNINGGIVTNAEPGNGFPAGFVNNALNNVSLTNGTLSATTGNQHGYAAWNINGTITSSGNSLISTSDPVYGTVMLNSSGGTGSVGVTTIDVADTQLTISAPLVQDNVDGDTSGLSLMSDSGTGTLVLSGTNTYMGGTTVNSGTLISTKNEAIADGTNLYVGDAANLAPNQASPDGVRSRFLLAA